MKTDKELLELAAKAAGLNVRMVEVDQDDNFSGLVVGNRGTKERIWWNPLKSDGDALRLVVKLSLAVDVSDTWVNIFYNNKVLVASPVIVSEKLEIARRAIVRAAAAIGESK